MLFAASVTTLMLAQPVSAGSLTSVVTDPVGDFSTFLPATITTPAYQDIVKASITLKDGRFVFVLDVAAPIPTRPTLPRGVMLEDWLFGMDTDRTTRPVGFPFPHGRAGENEFEVHILWDGTSFRGIFIDRRPLLVGMDAIISPVAFTIKGAELTVTVDAGKLANPSTFLWDTLTVDWLGPLGTFTNFPLDVAPDPGLPRATWPS